MSLQALPRIRLEIVSLSLRPQSRLAQDDSVVRLFVEYSFLDLPTEETPLSLPKPLPGRSINYNYSKGNSAEVGEGLLKLSFPMEDRPTKGTMRE